MRLTFRERRAAFASSDALQCAASRHTVRYAREKRSCVLSPRDLRGRAEFMTDGLLHAFSSRLINDFRTEHALARLIRRPYVFAIAIVFGLFSVSSAAFSFLLLVSPGYTVQAPY